MRFRLMFALCLVFFSAVSAAVTMTDVRYNRLGNKVQLVMDLDRPTQFEQFSLASPPRIVLDFPDTKRTGRAGLTVNQGAVGSLRTGYRDNRTLRVVIDLLTAAKANVYTLKADGRKGNRVVVDVYDTEATPALTLTSIDEQMPYVVFAGKSLDDMPRSQARADVRAQTPAPVQLQVSPAGVVQKRTALPSSVAAVKQDVVVCIDPGHGGKDPGASNKITGALEKNVVLAIAKRLRSILSGMPGYKVVMTRSSDVFIPLYDRPKKCRAAGADLFVSIHADAVERSEPSGSSVYILSTRGATSQLAKYLAKNENAVDVKWGVDVSKYDNDIQQALYNIQQEATLESSNVLASHTINQLGRIGNVHKPRVERANFVVLRSPEIPSMLVETGFISNPSEARLLASPAYQDKVARGIAAGIADYFREHLPQHMLLAK